MLRSPFVALLLLLNLSSVCYSDDISMVIGLALPPYVIAETDTGMELEIVREALAHEGHTLVPVYVPFWRVLAMLEQGVADAAMTVNEASGVTGVFYSAPHITYRNAAMALTTRRYPINTIADLGRYSILAFQSANKYLGDDFARMSANNPQYREIARQAMQITMLYSGRIDLVVMDVNIFRYYRQLERKVDTDADIEQFALFPPSHFKVAFARQDWRDSFDRGLKHLRDSGRYQAIINRFIKPADAGLVMPDTPASP